MMRLLAVILTPLLLSACVYTPQQTERAAVQPAAKAADQSPEPQKTVQRKRTYSSPGGDGSAGTGGTGDGGGDGTGGEGDSWGG